MPSCLNCATRSTCKEICPDIEALLPKPRSGGHKKEIPCDPQKMDKLIPEMRGIKERLGIRKHKQVKYSDNWEIS